MRRSYDSSVLAGLALLLRCSKKEEERVVARRNKDILVEERLERNVSRAKAKQAHVIKRYKALVIPVSQICDAALRGVGNRHYVRVTSVPYTPASRRPTHVRQIFRARDAQNE